MLGSFSSVWLNYGMSLKLQFGVKKEHQILLDIRQMWGILAVTERKC